MPQDYVIVFGAAVGADGRPSAVLRHRLEAAADWAKGRSNARILVTGGLGRHPPAEAEVMRRYLRHPSRTSNDQMSTHAALPSTSAATGS